MVFDGESTNGTGGLDGTTSRKMAAEAAAGGDGWGAIVAIVRGPLFDGLVRRLVRFEHVDADLAYDLFAEAIDELYAAIRAGRQIRDPVAWVRRSALNLAGDAESARRQQVPYDPELDGRPGDNAEAPDGVSRDLLRREALRVCFALVERIAQPTPRAVTRLILRAVAEGRPDGASAEEIAAQLDMTRPAVHTARSRGLGELVDLASADGHTLTLDFARRLEDAEPMAPHTLDTDPEGTT